MKGPSVLLEIRSAIDSSQYKSNSSSPVSSGVDRLSQYLKGLRSFSGAFESFPWTKIAWVDNTVFNADSCRNFAQLLPPNTDPFLGLPNHFGASNKGAGDIECWRAYRYYWKDFDFLCRIEARLQLRSLELFRQFYSVPDSYFVRAPGRDRLGRRLRQVQTGIFFARSRDLHNFVESVDLDQMVRREQSIENLMYAYFKGRARIQSRTDPLAYRVNPTSGLLEDY